MDKHFLTRPNIHHVHQSRLGRISSSQLTVSPPLIVPYSVHTGDTHNILINPAQQPHSRQRPGYSSFHASCVTLANIFAPNGWLLGNPL
ncbi:hypothetical protein LshimejAT787_0502420 [Lyophyllum shimeji]|uniref:Uncharacterized protein n=1 Tax=Lyophyllum shimeji TaxID=47721 RepID=A0A9P3PL86_LYOSH|nr:hypothetical protein LshimejAT787_0502420 [Lyophyllum shimeji]